VTASEFLHSGFAIDLELPADLEIGTATSSWQIEGAVAARGPSIWDDFAAVPGAIKDGSTGEPATDHVARVEEDLDLLAWLGVDAYRFSISWPRVIPGGTGAVSEAGLGFYDRLVDGLLERGIKPAITLYHWDLPSSLEVAGGWPVRDTAYHFAEFARVVGAKLGDRVDRWATLNEPWCAAFLGYAAGWHAPGRKDDAASLAAAYHLMLGHGLAMQELRAVGAKNIGIALNLIPAIPETPDSEAAAKHIDLLQNRLWLDLLAGRGVPAELIAATSDITDWSFVRADDQAVIGAPIDWLGENYYSLARVAELELHGEGGIGQDTHAFPGVPDCSFAPRPPLTDMGWEIVPEGLTQVLQMAAAALPGVPLWVTENGAAIAEVVEGDHVIDPIRTQYLQAHIAEVIKARELGVPVHGYYAWSLLDNLEWAEGWTKRFGIVRVDPTTLDRYPKNSALWLRDAIAQRNHRAGR
jgi:beta-glucosidase